MVQQTLPDIEKYLNGLDKVPLELQEEQEIELDGRLMGETIYEGNGTKFKNNSLLHQKVELLK